MGRQDERAMRREQVERLLASGMGVAEWCALNRVRKSTVYGWLNEFRESEPELFGGYDVAHAGDGSRYWFARVRDAISRQSSLALAGDPAQEPPVKSPGFAVVDTVSLAGGRRTSSIGVTITVRLAGAEIDVPAGADDADIARVLKAVSGL